MQDQGPPSEAANSDYVMIDDDSSSEEVFSNGTKAIIWGMQPRAVQVNLSLFFDTFVFDIKEPHFENELEP